MQRVRKIAKPFFPPALPSLLMLSPYLLALNQETLRYVPYKLTFLFLPLLMLTGIFSRAIFALVAVPLVLVNAFFLHVKLHWGVDQLESRIGAVLVSPPQEMLEYLRTYVSPADGLIFAHAVASFVALLFLFRADRPPVPIRRRTLALFLPAFPALLFLARGNVAAYPPVECVLSGLEAHARLSQVSQREARIRDQDASRTCSEGYDYIVVVLGESAQPDRMSAYGYPEPTTPFLDSLRPRLFEAISPSNQTLHAVPLLLTAASVDDFSAFFRSPSLVSELKACGYETHWISNQGYSGRDDDYVATIAREADDARFLNGPSYLNAKYDDQVLEALEEVPLRPRQAYFIHLMGSHFDYRKRYPPRMAFRPDGDAKSQYDNSLRYTDFILSRIFARFRDAGPLFLYVSDHGEVVGNGLHGHGFYPGFREEYRIPLAVWTNRPGRADTLQKLAAGNLLNADCFQEMVQYLAGMEESPALSFRSEVLSLSTKNARDYHSLASGAPPTPR